MEPRRESRDDRGFPGGGIRLCRSMQRLRPVPEPGPDGLTPLATPPRPAARSRRNLPSTNGKTWTARPWKARASQRPPCAIIAWALCARTGQRPCTGWGSSARSPSLSGRVPHGLGPRKGPRGANPSAQPPLSAGGGGVRVGGGLCRRRGQHHADVHPRRVDLRPPTRSCVQQRGKAPSHLRRTACQRPLRKRPFHMETLQREGRALFERSTHGGISIYLSLIITWIWRKTRSPTSDWSWKAFFAVSKCSLSGFHQPPGFSRQ